MDGESQTDGTLLVCTTNYLDRLPARVLRAGRLDTKIEVFAPPPEGRKAYFKYKLGEGQDESVIDQMVEATPDFSFAECREFLVNHRLLKKDISKSASLVRSMDRSAVSESRQKTEQDLIAKVVAHVKSEKLRVPNPDFLSTKKYSPQWKVAGNTIYYQLPDRTIIATLNRSTGAAQFDPNGLHQPRV